MNKSELIRLAEGILSESKTAVLATVDSDGSPRMRWMSPVFIRNFQNEIYAVTSTTFNKTGDINKNSNVQWMLQDKTLNTVITLNGQIRTVEDQSLKTEVLEIIGRQLQTFWTINSDPSSLVILETEITSGIVFYPVEGQKTKVSFTQEV